MCADGRAIGELSNLDMSISLTKHSNFSKVITSSLTGSPTHYINLNNRLVRYQLKLVGNVSSSTSRMIINITSYTKNKSELKVLVFTITEFY